MSNGQKIAIFTGNDVTAHIVLNGVVPGMIQSGYVPVLYMPEHKPSPKADLPELREYAFMERGLVNNVVYPFLEASPHPEGGKNISPSNLAEKHGLTYVPVKDVNDPAFVDEIKNDEDVILGISIRCFQIFKPPVIDTFNERKGLLNIHPGILPEYRGVMSTARAMAVEDDIGWTLHKVDSGIDTGRILSQTAKKPLSGSSLEETIKMAPLGVKSIMRAIEELASGNVLKGYPQAEGHGNYFTYPTKEELRENHRLRKAITQDPNQIVHRLTELFSDPASPHGTQLSAELSQAISRYKLCQNPDCAASRIERVAPAYRDTPFSAGVACHTP